MPSSSNTLQYPSSPWYAIVLVRTLVLHRTRVDEIMSVVHVATQYDIVATQCCNTVQHDALVRSPAIDSPVCDRQRVHRAACDLPRHKASRVVRQAAAWCMPHGYVARCTAEYAVAPPRAPPGLAGRLLQARPRAPSRRPAMTVLQHASAPPSCRRSQAQAGRAGSTCPAQSRPPLFPMPADLMLARRAYL